MKILDTVERNSPGTELTKSHSAAYALVWSSDAVAEGSLFRWFMAAVQGIDRRYRQRREGGWPGGRVLAHRPEDPPAGY
ncbi:hypothetical protein ACNKHS_01220 [Shigella flexneri]